MKRTLAWLLTLLLLVASVGAAAEGAMGGTLAGYPADLVEAKDFDSLIESEFDGSSAEKPIVSIWFDIYSGGKWRKMKSLTLTAGYAASMRPNGKYTGSRPRVAWLWACTDQSIATLYNDRICALSPGTATFTLKEYYSGKTAKLKVKVNPAPVQSISFSESSYSLAAGTMFDLSSCITLENGWASVKSLSYASSDKNVAAIDKNGMITAKGPGMATITVKSKTKPVVTNAVTVQVAGGSVSPSDVTYRFFGIGQWHYKKANPLQACRSDVRLIAAAYANASFAGKKAASVVIKDDLSGAGIKSLLKSMATCGADDNDVTVFYYSGHGYGDEDTYGDPLAGALCGIDSKFVSVNEVRSLLDQVPGKVVVILDSCFSGQYVESKNTFKNAANTFARSFIAGFAASSKALHTPATKDKYKILVACQPLQTSSTDGAGYSLFTEYAAEGMGQNAPLTEGSCSLKADANGDRAVSLQELYNYVESHVASRRSEDGFTQITMVWPQYDSTAVCARN